MNDELWTRQANALYFREVWHILIFKRELDSVIKKKENFVEIFCQENLRRSKSR